jgi:hypothetical protein
MQMGQQSQPSPRVVLKAGEWVQSHPPIFVVAEPYGYEAFKAGYQECLRDMGALGAALSEAQPVIEPVQDPLAVQ